MKRILLFIVSIFAPFTATSVAAVFAASKAPVIEEMSSYAIEHKQVDRVGVLRNFLAKYNSPLVGSAEAFVKAADIYNLDYRLLPAISCMESTCGRFLIPDSHNPFGWGVYGNGSYIKFDDYNEAIHGVAAGLNSLYFSKGLNTPEKIAPVYTPPNHTKWLWGVNFFINQMDEIALNM
ncbi:MAG: hypothetical protein WC243_01135 [Patescibacteria group bacterium]